MTPVQGERAAPSALAGTPPSRLKLLSFNIQVGLQTGHYGHYVSRAWRHILPGRDMHYTLDRMADLMRNHDFVAVQEGDAGSWRTAFVNQIEYLARRAGFDHHGLAVTRDLRPIAQHCLGFLSRAEPRRVTAHRLPGRIRGRRAMRVDLAMGSGELSILMAHLSLGAQDQRAQLDYLSRLVPDGQPTVLVGDLNCEPEALRAHELLRQRGLRLPMHTPATFPSWRPVRRLDHVLLSSQVEAHDIRVLPHAISDHLPISADISLRSA